MSDLSDPRISGTFFEGFAASLAQVSESLPAEKRDRLQKIKTDYFSRYGFEGGYERMNNRTVSQIFDEYPEKA